MCITKLMIRRALRHHQAGNVDALLKFYAEDVKFVFPGNNSWAGEFMVKKQSQPGCSGFIVQA